ncbi:MAG: DUF4115 domain-containing protein, partial [Zoogloeaceae bacterium]|nr:DUF4115 domain-containing protein [Zoogloeaceae bacterium]
PAPAAAAPAPAAAAPAPAAVPVPAAAPNPNNNLRMEFQDESWVEITGPNEQRLHSHLHPANSTHELNIRPPVSIVIGRATGVRLYYQGSLIPLRPNSNNVALVKLQ